MTANFRFTKSCQILAFSQIFVPLKSYLPGNTVWPQATGFQKLWFLAFFMNFCPLKVKTMLASLAMLNATFSVIFKHCENVLDHFRQLSMSISSVCQNQKYILLPSTIPQLLWNEEREKMPKRFWTFQTINAREVDKFENQVKYSAGLKAFLEYNFTVFENHRKSLIQYCERSELGYILSGQIAKTKKFKCDILRNF